MSRPFSWLPFETAPYTEIYQQQKELLAQRIAGEIPDTLLMGQHPHVITLGRGTHSNNILTPGETEIIEIERGGDVTYHGPGQLVGYPIFQLEKGEQDLHRYLRNLEEILIRALARYDVLAYRAPGWTGVWVADRKIASIGVAVRKWVTYHGFALNVTTDLDQFNAIKPCGFDSRIMTSLQRILAQNTPALEAVQTAIIKEIAEVFQRELLSTEQQSVMPICR